VLELLIVIALIILNAFFALSEMALMTSRKLRLKQMALESRGAQSGPGPGRASGQPAIHRAGRHHPDRGAGRRPSAVKPSA
jgi:hypothetical protein